MIPVDKTSQTDFLKYAQLKYYACRKKYALNFLLAMLTLNKIVLQLSIDIILHDVNVFHT